MLFNINRNNLETVAQGRLFPSVKEVSAIVLTFSLTVLAWIFFRAENVSHAFGYLKNIFSDSLLSMPEIEGKAKAYTTLALIGFLLTIEWLSRDQQHALSRMKVFKKRPVRWAGYVSIVLVIYFLGNFSESSDFIYFQF